MPEFNNQIDLHVKAGGDYTAQVFWWDDYDNPVPVTGPLKMEVRTADEAKTLVVICEDTTQNTADFARGYLASSDVAGLVEIFIPAYVTRRIPPGTYNYDLFANYKRSLNDGRTPLWGEYHLQAVAAGHLVVAPNITDSPTPKPTP